MPTGRGIFCIGPGIGQMAHPVAAVWLRAAQILRDASVAAGSCSVNVSIVARVMDAASGSSRAHERESEKTV
jgi:coenzyme F420-reducing hydrogenase gamma subunit